MEGVVDKLPKPGDKVLVPFDGEMYEGVVDYASPSRLHVGRVRVTIRLDRGTGPVISPVYHLASVEPMPEPPKKAKRARRQRPAA
jgi:hypothetical protein